MFGNINVKGLPGAALLYLALALPLGSCAGSPGIIEDSPEFHTPIVGVASDAQLIEQLRAAGFEDIRVTPFYPNDIDRRPELTHGFVSADDPDAKVAPVHFGWNGTAVRDSRFFDIYVDRADGR
jgi:hypothetical protein